MAEAPVLFIVLEKRNGAIEYSIIGRTLTGRPMQLQIYRSYPGDNFPSSPEEASSLLTALFGPNWAEKVSLIEYKPVLNPDGQNAADPDPQLLYPAPKEPTESFGK